MKILIPTAGPLPAKENAEYIANIATRLGAELIALHVLQEEEQAGKGEEALNLFSETGQNVQVKVTKILRKGEIVSTIIEVAEQESAALIVMGASRGKVLAEWLSADVMTKTTTPVVVIPHELKRL